MHSYSVGLRIARMLLTLDSIFNKMHIWHFDRKRERAHA
jgi:hypothetical protein